MYNLKKISFRILIALSAILILLAGLFIFVFKEFYQKETEYKPTVVITQKTTPEFERGKEIFSFDCNACHKSHSLLGNEHMKLTIQNAGIDYFKLFITNQDSLVNSKDIYAIKLKEEFNDIKYNHNFKYSENDLNSLVEYLK